MNKFIFGKTTGLSSGALFLKLPSTKVFFKDFAKIFRDT